MKKIIKNRIFLCVIVGICCLGIGVYAGTQYQASEVIYNPSSGESMTVNDALNELYEKEKCKIWCAKKISEVGDYIRMTPTNTTYTISKELTGYSKDQTINPSELNLWRIIKINEDGTIEMISENVSSASVYFQGKNGYLNYIGTLNEIAGQYENSKYVVDSRIIGYNGQTEYITDTSKFTNPAPWKSSTSDNSNETLGGGDIMYEKDTNLVNEVLGTLIATNPSGTASSYWLGSRNYHYSNSSHFGWNLRIVNGNGEFESTSGLYIYDSSSGWSWASRKASIRPILTLKSGLNVTGSGTSEDPWVLE